ncbi:MAG: bifunctional DNA-formamidopyrimidine glycosylase/DNA-(apurinic or apyrimidinic site) lyase [Solirubrobacteraceae bacterium]
MPELPEVETIRRQLAPRLEGRQLVSVEILDHRFSQPAAAELVAAALTGARVTRLGRRGKYLIWELDDDRSLLVHLRMTGVLLLDADPDLPHTRVRFGLSDGHLLTFVDPRRFGNGRLMPTSVERDAYLNGRLGPEPFTTAFSAAYLRSSARDRSLPVKSFILDQRRIAGVGNIYADEALYRAGVHPLRQAGKLTFAQWQALREAIETALSAGIDAKGATIDDFRHLDGAHGSFQDSFLVHRRAGAPCFRCGTTIRKLVVGGRGSYVCEHCQPPPRRTAVSRPAVSAALQSGRRPAAR